MGWDVANLVSWPLRMHLYMFTPSFLRPQRAALQTSDLD